MSNTIRWRAAARWLAVCLACCLCLAALACHREAQGETGSDAPLSPGLSMIEGEAIYDDGVAMRTDNFTVTPGMMAYFFYTVGGSMLPQIEAQKPFDDTKSLHEQMLTDTLSFYDAIMNATLEHVSYLLICNEAACAEGEALSAEELELIEQTLVSYRTTAAGQYGVSVDAYLQMMYGPLIDEDDMRAVLEMESLANRYSIALTESLERGITMDQIRAYAAEQGLNDATPSRNIAYIYIEKEQGVLPESKVSGALAALTASPTLQTLLGLGEFGLPGTEKNLTPQNGGIPAITEWLFAAERRVGDVGRVDLSGATYVLLYTENGMTCGEVTARMALFDAAFVTWYNGWVDELNFGYNYDCLDGYDIS